MSAPQTNRSAPSLEQILRHLDVRRDGDGRFHGTSIEMPIGRIFGGQVMAQILVAAWAAVPAKTVKVLHVQFARDGRAPDPIDIDVDVLHNGGTYATCDVRVSQDGRALADATVSLHVRGEGPEQQAVRPRSGDPMDAVPMQLGMMPFETRVVDGVDLGDEAVGPATFAFWLRNPDLDAPPAVHQALLAFVSDLTSIGTALRAVPGESQYSSHRTIQTAVTAHTVWFHGPVDLTDWVCCEQWAPVTGGGRSFGFGHVFLRTGELVASYAQDAMVRWLRGRPGHAPRTSA